MCSLSVSADILVLLHGVRLVLIHALQAPVIELEICFVEARQVSRKISVSVEVTRIYRLYRRYDLSRPDVGGERPQVGIIRARIVGNSNLSRHLNNPCRTSFLMWNDDCRNRL